MTPTAPVVAETASSPRAAGLPPAVEHQPVDLTLLKRLLWAYLALWVVEGALRKWILPGLASPLLIVRDPILLLMYALAMAKGVFPRGAFIGWITGISLLALTLSLVGSKAPLFVQMFGFRADFLHLPLVFLIPNILDRDDLRKVGLWTLLIALPMSFLVLLQFSAGLGSRLNVGVGGEGTMLDAAYGHIRPSGTFSFGNGLGDFSGVVAAFCVYGLLQKRVFPRLVWLASLPALATMLLLSGSRAAVGLVVVVLSTVLLICLMRPRYVAAAMKIVSVCTLGVVTAGSVAVFRDGMQVFAYRFGDASDVREGFVDRFFGMFLTPFQLFSVVDFYGVGLGMGTNVAAGLLYQGQRRFLYAEGELGRVMYESGPVMGPVYLLLRVAIVLCLFGQAMRTLRRDGHPLPMLLLGACSIDMILGQFGQATTLGFATITCGLCLAANRPGASEAVEAATPLPERGNPLPPLPPARPRASAMPGGGSIRPETPPSPPPVAPAVAAGTLPRGRSAYAERMHREAEEKSKMQTAEGKSPKEETDPPA